MRVDEVLHRLGGVSEAGTLCRLTSRAKVRRAVRRGAIVRDARGRYALPDAVEALRAASRLSGVASHDSAAAYYGWETKHRAKLPTVTVPRTRKVSPERRAGVRVRWADLKPKEIVGGELSPKVTAHGRTVMGCAATMPFDEALAIADSALRHEDVTSRHLVQLAEAMPDKHRARCLRVALEADGRAANPFESVLRAIALDVPGLDLVPQLSIYDGLDFLGRPDLVDEARRIVLEADSFEFHGKRRALTRDCERYNAFTLRDWFVLRFAWEHVMYQPEYVAECLHLLVQQRPVRHAVAAVARRIPA